MSKTYAKELASFGPLDPREDAEHFGYQMAMSGKTLEETLALVRDGGNRVDASDLEAIAAGHAWAIEDKAAYARDMANRADRQKQDPPF